APGNSIGTLTVDGDYTQLAGSTYEAEIDPDGSSDLIDVTGAAGIEGGTVFALKAPGGYDTGTRYTILTAAGGVTGTYGTLDQNAPFVDLSLAYDPNAVYLDVARNDASFCDVAISANQCAVGDGAEGQGPGNPIYDAIVGLPDEETAPGCLRSAFW
ncbi:autotransporter outer membrane beta-barrel domain-containing protein, partial [Mesorhizobium sp. B1-1-5]|uniref:autotransporter outer membrane beta-barrel domain-containing protein n=1 Tax=Mesorhizobium sp. B1-1-5 TaxID=2589979 RepID=UPI0024847A4B